jgi:hypothetical protein
MSTLTQFAGSAGSGSSKIQVEVILLGGGGGKGADFSQAAGGAGAGAALYKVSHFMASPATTYPITVGAAGAAGVTPYPTGAGGVGGSSIAFGIRALGGGGGGAGSSWNPSGFNSNSQPATTGSTTGNSGFGYNNGYPSYIPTISNGPGAAGAPISDSGYSSAYSVFMSRNAGGKSPSSPTSPFFWRVKGSRAAGAGNFNLSGFTFKHTSPTTGGGSSPYSAAINSTGLAEAGNGTRIEYDTPTSTIMYGVGGYHGQGTPYGPAPSLVITANTGSGQMSWNPNSGPAASPAAASGVVFVRYPTAYAAAPAFPGATDLSPQTPGFRTYKFTGNGSITLP